MNFKMQDKQNQLIERISDTHLIVGVDIAQQLHVARAVNFRGIVVGDPLTFENNEEGFIKLLSWIQSLHKLKKLDSTIVGMEGEADLSAIYEVIRESEKSRKNKHWREKVRQTLQIHQNFSSIERGKWKLNIV